MKIRTLRADEIECRVQQVKQNGCVLLLYKDARCDMRILDEVFGIDGWEREHQVVNGNLYCTVRVWSEKRNQWISKQDVGTESNTEKQKGEASDSFKRACFNIGIGRELYSAPFTWISLGKDEVKEEKTAKGTRYSLDYKVKFEVKEIEYDENREISKLIIVDQNGKERFRLNPSKSQKIKDRAIVEEKIVNKEELISEDERKELFLVAKGLEIDIVKQILYSYGFESSDEITKKEFKNICETIEKSKQMYGVNVGA